MTATIRSHGPWVLIGTLGAVALAIVATNRGEHINALWVVVAAIAVYLIAYRYYSLFIAEKVMRLDRRDPRPPYATTMGSITSRPTSTCCSATTSRPSPARGRWSGRCSRRRWATCRARCGSWPASCFAGAVQDFMVLFVSMRRDGRSLGELIRGELGPVPGVIALFGTFMIMVIILAVLALIVVKALAESPWGTFTVAATIPIAIFMGLYTRYIRPGAIGEVSLIGFVLLMLAIVFGQNVAESPTWSPYFTYTRHAVLLAVDRLRLRRVDLAGVAAPGAA